MSGKFEYDPLAQYVERERTRSTLIEITKPQSSGSIWRLFFFTGLIVGAGAGAYWFYKSPRGQELFAGLKRSASSSRKDPKKPAEPAQAQVQAQSHAAAPSSSVEAEGEVAEEEARLRKLQNLSSQIASMAAGKAPQAPVAAVPQPAATPPRDPSASSGNGIEGGEKDVQLAPSLDMISDAGTPIAPTYRQLTRIPGPYLDEKKEFPEAP